MKNPILFMLASPSCPPGWYPVPGAAPPRSGDAVALVLPSLYPVSGAEVTAEQAAMLAACLPPEGYVPERMDLGGIWINDGSRTIDFFGFQFSAVAIDFVRAHHPGVRWAPGGADVEGFHTITEIDMLHGFVDGRCVACVCRMAPTPEATCPA